MKVERTGQTRGGTAKKVGKSAQNGGFVIPDVGGSDNVTDTKAVAGAQPVAPVDSLLALQEVSDQSQGRKRAVRRASSMLDVLEDIRLGLLTGRLPRTRLEELVKLVESKRENMIDPRLETVLDEIELRAKVELAKLHRHL